MTSVDVLVAGGGPAGAAAAIALARAGLDVLVVDKSRFPRDKYCGDGLTADALRRLQALGLRTESMASWRHVGDVMVRSARGRVVHLPLPSPGVFAAVARRTELDAAVLDLARASGAKVADGHAVTGARQDADGVTVTVDGLGAVRARHAVAADGAWSPMRRFLGVTVPGHLGEWHAFRQYFTGVAPSAAKDLWVWFEPDILPGYAWSFPLDGGRANVGFGIQRGGRVSTREMKDLWPRLLERPHIRAVLGADCEPEAPHRAWPIPARVGRIRLASGRVLFAGDAAAAADPMTGEGIAQALLTGDLAARAVVEHGIGGPGAVARAYHDAVRSHLVADDRMSRLLVRVLRHRRGTDWALAVAGASSWTRRNFGRWLFEDYPRAFVATPRRWRHHSMRGPGAWGDPPT